jgi:predicted 2-oxoglutarate/Fe(II)-dependent dioxygenase YbiX
VRSDQPGATLRPHTIPGFLTPYECQELRREIDAASQQEAEVWLGHEFGVVPESRLGTITALAENTERYVHERLWEVVPELARIFGCELRELSDVTALTYRRGDHFAAHSDGGVDADNESEVPDVARRRVSLVLALNDGASEQREFSGGELRFYPRTAPGQAPADGDEIVEVRSHSGLLVAFPSPLVHQVMPVTDGCRYSLALWALAAR